MIDRREILEAASAFSLLPSIVEKDYLLGWMLAGINALEMQPVPITAESYIKAIGPRFSQKGSPLEVRGSPEEHGLTQEAKVDAARAKQVRHQLLSLRGSEIVPH